MIDLISRRPARAAALGLALLAGACDEPPESPLGPELGIAGEETQAWVASQHGGERDRAFEVYSQNVYLGGDTGPLFSLDFSNLPAVLAATNVFWNDVQQSDVPGRISEIAGEIASRQPDVVGLQEMLLFEILDGSFAPVDDVDFLALIEGEIATRGLPYETEVVQAATTSQLPLAFDPSVGVTRWLRFTDRVIILRRSDVWVTAVDQGVYAATYTLGPVTLKRGWARVSVDHRGVPHHFVTTHLEIQALAPVQAAQASQLLGLVAGLEGVTIIGGDLNSDAAAGPGAPSYTPTYELMLDSGFEDVWELAPRSRADPGYTCCQADDLRNQVSGLDQRIDFVLVRSSAGPTKDTAPGSGFYRFEQAGDEQLDRTPSGLWPSDHAGLVGSLGMLPEAAP